MHPQAKPLLSFILLLPLSLQLPAFAGSTATTTTTTTPTCSLFFTGSRASELEPCGCHANQAGGVQYEAALYRPAGAEEAALRVDAGGWAGGDAFTKSFTAMKTRYLLRGLARLGFDAINFGAAEATLSRYYYEQLRAESPKAWGAIVSANVFCRMRNNETMGHSVEGKAALEALRPAFADARVVTRTLPGGRVLRVAITGIATTATQAAHRPDPAAKSDFRIEPPVPSLAPVVARLRPRADLLIVLVDGPARECAALARAFPEVDLFVASVAASPNASPGGGALTKPERDGRVRADGTAARPAILVCGMPKGREVGRVRLAPEAAGKWTVAAKAESLAVSNRPAPDPELVQLIEEFKRTTRQFEAAPPLNAEMIYAGEASCLRCHAQAHEQWVLTPHARALETLSERNQQFNPECLPCHTLGFRQANGFYSVTQPQSEPMGSVQCENCHGPGRRHAQTQLRLENNPLKRLNPQAYEVLAKQARESLPKRRVPAEVCRQCHQPDHDDRFDYHVKVVKIVHSKGSANMTAGATAALQAYP